MPGKLIQINHFYLEVINKINQYKGGNLRDAVCRLFLTNYLNAKEDFENLLTVITEYPIYIKVFR